MFGLLFSPELIILIMISVYQSCKLSMNDDRICKWVKLYHPSSSCWNRTRLCHTHHHTFTNISRLSISITNFNLKNADAVTFHRTCYPHKGFLRIVAVRLCHRGEVCIPGNELDDHQCIMWGLNTSADRHDEDSNGFHTILTTWKQIYHRRDLIGLPYIKFKATRAVMSKTGVSVCLAGDPVLQHWLILREVFSYLQYPQPPLGEIPPKPIIGTWLFGSPLMYLTSWGHWASQ